MLMFQSIRNYFTLRRIGTILITGGFAAVMFSFALEYFLAPNKAPHAQITFNTSEASPYEYLYFDSASSYDPEGGQLTFKWFINNEFITDSPAFSHAFTDLKTHHVKLRVCDSGNQCNDDSTFINIIAPSTVLSVKDALKYFRYRIGWNSLIRKDIKFYDISSVSFIEPYFIKIFYKYKSGGKYYLVLSEHNKKLFGIWNDDDGKGELELVFSADYQSATGWWKYENDSRKYDLSLQKTSNAIQLNQES